MNFPITILAFTRRCKDGADRNQPQFCEARMDFTSLMHSLGLQSAMGETGILAIGLILAAALAGLAAGTLGIGGGLVLVPAVYIVLGEFGTPTPIRFAMAVATALAAMAPTAALMFLHHRPKNSHWWPDWRILPALAGAVPGAAALLFLPPLISVSLFTILALISTGLILFGRNPTRAPRDTLAAGWWIGLGVISGLTGAISGIGASAWGTRAGSLAGLSNSARHSAGWDFAIGLAGAATLIITGFGFPLLPDHSLGFVNLAIAGMIAPVMFLAASFVAPYADTARKNALDKVFALFIIISTTKMLLLVVS